MGFREDLKVKKNTKIMQEIDNRKLREVSPDNKKIESINSRKHVGDGR